MVKKLDPAVQMRKIKREQEREKKSHQKHLKQMESSRKKMSPFEQAREDYVTKMNMLGHGSTKKEVDEAYAKADALYKKHGK
jgi:hypothetical protein